MLTGNAQKYPFDVLKQTKWTLKELELAVKYSFLTPEQTRVLLRE